MSMKKVLLDTSIIIRYPKILGLKDNDSIFVITIDVLTELNHRTNASWNNNLGALIDQAVEDGTVEIINSSLPKIQKHQNSIPKATLSETGTSILAAALFFKEEGQHVQIASSDRDIQIVCQRLSIDILRHDEIQLKLQLYSQGDDAPTPLIKEISAFEKKERLRLIWQILIGLGFAVLGAIIIEYFRSILSTIHIWGILFLFLVIAIGLFFWREKKQLSYGVFEFIVGFLAIIVVLSPVEFDYQEVISDVELDIKVLGGLYIMVRGQDNIVKGLRGHTYGVFLREKIGLGKS